MEATCTIIEGIKCYAPELAFKNANFPNGYFELLSEIEPKNFWYKARSRIIEYLFKHYIGAQPANVMEIGSGTGFVLKGLSRFNSYKLVGAELHIEAIKFAKKYFPEIEYVQVDARRMPYNNEFDVIGAFDILEHIDEDILVMQSIYRSLKEGGYFIFSVPQHKWLWSALDEDFYHRRRYSKKEVLTKLRNVGFSISFINSFLFTLLPIMFLSRLRGKNKKQNSNELRYSLDELRINPILNTIMDFCIRFDELLIKAGIQLPVGGSLIVVAKKD